MEMSPGPGPQSTLNVMARQMNQFIVLRRLYREALFQDHMP